MTAFYSDQTRQRTKHELGMAGAVPLPTCLQVPKVLHQSISPVAECLHTGVMKPHGGTLWCVLGLICPFTWQLQSVCPLMVPHPVLRYDANSQRSTMPWAPELISLATVQASHRMGESAKGLPTHWETGVSPANPLAPQPGEC